MCFRQLRDTFEMLYFVNSTVRPPKVATVCVNEMFPLFLKHNENQTIVR